MRTCLVVMCVVLAFTFQNNASAQDEESLCTVSEAEILASEEATPSAHAVSLDGRLGGSLETFLELYGIDDSFSQEGCSGFSSISSQSSADDSGEIVTIIDLWADRDADIEAGTLDDPSDSNWSIEEATAIAMQLLPADSVLDDPEETEALNALVSGYSESLALVLSAENYAYHGSDGEPGDAEVLFGLSRDGTVWSIAVQLGGIN